MWELSYDSKLCQQLWPEIAPQNSILRVRGKQKKKKESLKLSK